MVCGILQTKQLVECECVIRYNCSKNFMTCFFEFLQHIYLSQRDTNYTREEGKEPLMIMISTLEDTFYIYDAWNEVFQNNQKHDTLVSKQYIYYEI